MKWLVVCLFLVSCRQDLRITFFDVGQGDSALIRFPSGESWLVDAGGGWGDWDRGRELFLELTRYGITRLDVALLSHPDQDHGLGFRGIMGLMKVREFWWNGVFATDDPLLKELFTTMAPGTKRIAWNEIAYLDRDRVAVTLVPLRSGNSKNDKPLAVHLEYGGCRILLAGDAESEAEKILEKKFADMDVWKAHHHGSRSSTSPSLLRTLRPKYTVISVGAGNPYRHPSPAVVKRLRQAGGRVLRTDFHGYIEFAISEGKVRCESAHGGCGITRCSGEAFGVR